MNAHTKSFQLSRRTLLRGGGALTVAFALSGPAGKALAQAAGTGARTLDLKEVDAFLAINADGTVTVFSGKVDLGQGLRIAIPQIAAEELGIAVDKVHFVEGDTALTPDQGRTSGSTGIMRGGMQIRQAAATARKGLIELASKRLDVPAEGLAIVEGTIRPAAGGPGVTFAELLGGKNFDLKLDPKAPLKNPSNYTLVGKSLKRPDIVAKCTGGHIYMQNFAVPNMLHARVIRPQPSAPRCNRSTKARSPICRASRSCASRISSQS